MEGHRRQVSYLQPSTQREMLTCKPGEARGGFREIHKQRALSIDIGAHGWIIGWYNDGMQDTGYHSLTFAW